MKQMSENKEVKKVYIKPASKTVELDNTNILAASPLYPGSGNPDD